MSRGHREALHDAVSALLRLIKVRETSFQAAHQALQLQPVDIHTLKFLAATPGCKLSELAAFLGVAVTTAGSAIDRLVERGLVTRARRDDNRRAIALSLTSEGARAHADLIAEESQTMQLMLDALAPDERGPFVAAMGKIAAHLSSIR